MEWVEVEGKTVDVAVKAALEELGIDSVEEAEIEVIKEPERGFLGFGGSMALVRVKPRPKKKRRRRGRRRGGKGGEDEQRSGQQQGRQRERSDSKGDGRQRREGQQGDRTPERAKPERARAERSQGRSGSDRGGGDSGRGRRGARRPGGDKQSHGGRPRDGVKDRDRASQEKVEPAMQEESAPIIDIDGQAEIVKEFLVGLLDAFGLEGDVDVRIDDGIVFADVTGEQTEALVGTRGVILQSVLELCRTVVQRKSHAGVRIRLDIAGYAGRRREALRIYAARLAEQVLEDGEEVMLEPMNPADRKVVHDAVGEIDDVRTYSEGEEPNRSVVVGLAPGVEARGKPSTNGEADDEQDPRDDEESADDGSADESDGDDDGDDVEERADDGSVDESDGDDDDS